MSDEADIELGSNLEPRPAPKKRSVPKKKPEAKKAAGMPDRTWIVLEDNDDIPPTGLPVSHNGNAYIIMPGEPVHVPNHILEILDHAVTSGPIVDRHSKRVVGYRDRLQFPYRKVAAPIVDE